MTEKIKDGLHTEWYDNGNKKIEYFILDGKLHGKCTKYYENGNYSDIINYKNGKKHGKHISYLIEDDGLPFDEENFENGISEYTLTDKKISELRELGYPKDYHKWEHITISEINEIIERKKVYITYSKEDVEFLSSSGIGPDNEDYDWDKDYDQQDPDIW